MMPQFVMVLEYNSLNGTSNVHMFEGFINTNWYVFQAFTDFSKTLPNLISAYITTPWPQ